MFFLSIGKGLRSGLAPKLLAGLSKGRKTYILSSFKIILPDAPIDCLLQGLTFSTVLALFIGTTPASKENAFVNLVILPIRSDVV